MVIPDASSNCPYSLTSDVKLRTPERFFALPTPNSSRQKRPIRRRPDGPRPLPGAERAEVEARPDARLCRPHGGRTDR